METIENIDYLPSEKEQGTLPTFANMITLEIRLLYASVSEPHMMLVETSYTT